VHIQELKINFVVFDEKDFVGVWREGGGGRGDGIEGFVADFCRELT